MNDVNGGNDVETNVLSGEVISNVIQDFMQKSHGLLDKRSRRSASIKFVTSWENILDEQWKQKNAGKVDYDFSGVKIDVKRARRGKLMMKRISSTTDKFLEMQVGNYGSIDCIYENSEATNKNMSMKKFSSTGDLLNGDGEVSNLNIFGSNYLISMKDIDDIENMIKRRNNSEVSFNSDSGELSFEYVGL